MNVVLIVLVTLVLVVAVIAIILGFFNATAPKPVVGRPGYPRS